MSEQQYKSVIGKYMSLYLSECQRKGHKAQDVKFVIATIDRFLYSINFQEDHVDRETYYAWLETQQSYKASTKYQHISIFRRLLIFMCDLGVECYIPRLPEKHASGFVPYVFSEEEMNNIFAASDSLRMKEHHSNSVMIAIPAMIRLLYSTGVRISEALAIKNKDVDYNRHVIVLNDTKNSSQRLAPINESLEDVLKQYCRYRDMIPASGIKDPDHHFFVSSLGAPIARKTVLSYFHKLLLKANIAYKGYQNGPRVHDLRHTACVHSMTMQVQNGKDIYCSLPSLSVFMGHKKVLDTEYYLRLTADMYPDVVKLDTSITANISSVLRQSIQDKAYETE